jgi:N-acetylglucosamine-6-phosphate deacetylase
MDQAVANLAAWTGATDYQARACASVNPSRLIVLDPAGTER